MPVDEKTFFQESTLRICGNLDVEKFLYESFNYIKDFIPTDQVFLTSFDYERGNQLLLAKASSKGGEIVDVSIPMPSRGQKTIERPSVTTEFVPRADMIPPTIPWIAKGFLKKDDSLLFLRLTVGEEIIGAITFSAHSPGLYSQEHADLLYLLREPFAVAFSNSLRYRELLKLKDLLHDHNRFLHGELHKAAGEEIIGANFGLKDVMHKVQKVSALDSPVLLLGETGVGKDVIANAIHYSSSRSKGPFINVNCGAIPDTLIDSELFGHEKGPSRAPCLKNSVDLNGQIKEQFFLMKSVSCRFRHRYVC